MATPERAFPSAETEPLRRVVRRTTIIRFGLALALVAALALAFLAARDSDVRHAPLVPSGTTGVVVLDLSASVYEAAFGSTLQKMARQGERAGLVVFSDSAYEVLPPGTPGRELLPFLRFFRPDPNSTTGSFPRQPMAGLPRRHAHLGRSRRGARVARLRGCEEGLDPHRLRPGDPPRRGGAARPRDRQTCGGTASTSASFPSTRAPRSGCSWRRSSARARS